MTRGNLPPIPDDPDLIDPKPKLDEINQVITPPVSQPQPIVQQPAIQPQPVVQTAPQVTVVDVNNSNVSNIAQMQNTQTLAQAEASVGLAQANIDDKVVDEQINESEEHWLKAYWRPSVAWSYLIICMMDFVVFPFISMFMPVINHGFGINMNYQPWTSLTLSNGGLFHAAMGAILGVTAWTRGKEKMLRVDN
jgi:Holin of 3TMs, for gene-transfer release